MQTLAFLLPVLSLAIQRAELEYQASLQKGSKQTPGTLQVWALLRQACMHALLEISTMSAIVPGHFMLLTACIREMFRYKDAIRLAWHEEGLCLLMHCACPF